jgi:hypothetical protein
MEKCSFERKKGRISECAAEDVKSIAPRSTRPRRTLPPPARRRAKKGAEASGNDRRQAMEKFWLQGVSPFLNQVYESNEFEINRIKLKCRFHDALRSRPSLPP